jgi:hypothetical protein
MSPPLDPTLDTSVLLAGYLYLKLLRNRTALVFKTSLLHSPPNITKAISDIIPYSSNQGFPSHHPAPSKPDLEGQHSIRALLLKLVQNES